MIFYTWKILNKIVYLHQYFLSPMFCIMETAVLIAKIGAIFYLAIGLGVLFNPSFLKKAMDGFAKNMWLMLMTSRILIIIGMLIVLSHNVWTWSRTLIITIIGWIALVKWVSLLLFPNLFMKMGEGVVKKASVAIIPIALVLGLILLYFGYLA